MALIQQSSLNATSSSHSTNQVVVPPQVGLSPTEALGGNQSGNPCVFSCVSKGKLCSWILDLGATDHICCSLIHFSTYTKIAPLNGSNVMAHYAGIVEFSPTLLLTNVLFLPQFTFNLVFVPNLPNHLIVVSFFILICVIKWLVWLNWLMDCITCIFHKWKLQLIREQIWS